MTDVTTATLGPAVGYYAAGRQYFEAFHLLATDARAPSDPSRLVLPLGALVSFSIELLLKAYLTDKGMTRQELSRYGVRHNLDELLRLAVGQSLMVAGAVSQLVQVLDQAHAEHHFRYMPENGVYTLLNHASVIAIMDPFHEQIRVALGYGPTPG
jgi:hypothetical protein